MEHPLVCQPAVSVEENLHISSITRHTKFHFEVLKEFCAVSVIIIWVDVVQRCLHGTVCTWNGIKEQQTHDHQQESWLKVPRKGECIVVVVLN